jgi:hypothetical protein
MKRRLRASLTCAALCTLSAGVAAEETALARATSAAIAAATQRDPSTSPEQRLSESTILSPRGFAADALPADDDFLQRAVANRRVELVRFVDRENRRVFLGLTKDGYLGIHVQKRDR